jgi:hypothetical protein
MDEFGKHMYSLPSVWQYSILGVTFTYGWLMLIAVVVSLVLPVMPR